MFSDSNRIIAQGSSAPPKPDRPTRQFRVTHTATGIEIYVNVTRTDEGYVPVAGKAGLRYPMDCDVRIVPRGQEIPLPFDGIPLIIRRGVREATA